MPDKFSPEKRSYLMAQTRKRGNKSREIAMVNLLRALHITGWRRHQPLIENPDFTFYKQRVIIFVDGCFWHVCPKHSNAPINNVPYWEKKLKGNAERDRRVSRELRKQGWRVLRIWEHELKNPKGIARKITRVLEAGVKTGMDQ